MVKRGFNIEWIAIEGFKGFTERQEIKLNDKHLFILGPNGYGKSSIVEAVRWGLFGSTRRPSEVISNQTYSGRCRVEIGLDRSGEHFRLQRTLIRGASGGSDAELTDATGAELSIRDVLPQLESVPAGEGMHIIYTAQSAPARREAEDLTPFARTIFAYLGLSDIPLIMEALDQFLRDQEDIENELGSEITAKRSEIEEETSRNEGKRDGYINNPPWGEGSVPDLQATETRIWQFYTEIDGRALERSTDARNLLEDVRDAIDRGKARGTEELEGRREELGTKSEKLTSLLSRAGSEFAAYQSTNELRTRAQVTMDGILGAQSINELRLEVEKAEGQLQGKALLLRIHEQSRAWLVDCEDAEGANCPVCQRPVDFSPLVSTLDETLSKSTSNEQEASERLDSLRGQLVRATESQSSVQNFEARISEIRRSLDHICQEAEPVLRKLAPVEQLVTMLEEQRDEINPLLQAVQREIEQRDSIHSEWERRFLALQDEVYYHNVQSRLRTLRGDLSEVERAETQLGDFTAFGNGLRKVREEVEVVLTGRLRQATPKIDQALTKSFHALTEHPIYDQLKIDGGRLPQLHMLVDSSGDPFPGSVPSEVLNGQAMSALELVPYFAFSEFADFPFEVHLLLLDDPTQSFDARHIDILVERLANLGNHMQLIIATHEVDHFERLLPRYFDDKSSIVVKVEGFARQTGPNLSHG